MKARYVCARCDMKVDVIIYKHKFKKGRNKGKGYHNRMDCEICGRFIKFIGNKELDDIAPGWRKELDFKVKSDHSSVDLSKIIENQKEIKFLLDVIIDHLQIRDDFVSDYKLKVV